MTLLINFPTHKKGHILDLVCCSGVTPCNLSAVDLPISDHKLVIFDLHLQLSKSIQNRSISFRNLKNINITELNSLISTSTHFSSPHSLTVAELVDHYNTNLQYALDTLAPLKTRTVTFTRSSPWYTPELCQLKTRGCQLERLVRKTGLVVHQQMYLDHLTSYKSAINAAKSTYYSHIINSADSNTQILFSTVNKLLKPAETPSHLISTSQCQEFLDFFNSKTVNIHQQLTPPAQMQATFPQWNTLDPPLSNTLSTFQLWNSFSLPCR